MDNPSEFIVRGTIVNPTGQIIEDGGVRVKEGTIMEVGSYSEISTKFPSLDTIGDKSKLVIPGFVNTHSHSVQTLFRGAADDLELLDWLDQVILPGEATLTSEELYASCRIGYSEMLLSGITTTNDMLTAKHALTGLKAAEDSGIRGKVGKMLMDRNVPSGLLEDTNRIMNEVKYLSSLYPKGGRIEFSITPRFIITCSDELMERSAKFARENDLLFHTHVSENLGELSEVRRLTSKSYFEAMDHFGAVHNGSIFAHCVWPTMKEMSLIEKSGINISHNPSSNGKLSSGIAPINEYLEMGNNVGLATDGSPATGGHDMFLEMKLASFYQKARLNDPTVLPALQVFKMATLMGAKALGYSDVGLIKEGFKADIVLLNRDTPNAYPMYNPISFIVYTATKREVSTVIVDGKIIVKNGRLSYYMDHFYNVASQYAKDKPFQTRSA